MKTKNLLLVILVAMGSSIVTVSGLKYFSSKSFSGTQEFGVEPTNVRFTNFSPATSDHYLAASTDFTSAAALTTPTVVHINTSYTPKQRSNDMTYDPFRDFFGNDFWNFRMDPYGSRPKESSGSGVIISDDGYIVTNNHVVADGDKISVILNNKKEYSATVIGSDPSTDLALIKIDAGDLPFISFGNSDSTKVGEWVLAVGNPFNLESTVTAGIISAKGRNINILKDKGSIESFIQTDAAVNPGNSGGALVNLRGELIGINSAIATSTGQYEGYSFAIPISLVKKVMDDLLEFGQVQRGLLGVQITDVNANISEQFNLGVNNGVLITYVNKGSAAEESAMQPGDVITAINNHRVTSVSELQEWVARNRPGKEIQVTFLRGSEVLVVKTKLKDIEGRDEITKREIVKEFNGLTVEDVNYHDLAKLKLEGGVQAKRIANGKWKEAGLKENFIIAFIDRVPVDNVEDFNRILEYKRGGILIEGYYPDGQKKVYGLDW